MARKTTKKKLSPLKIGAIIIVGGGIGYLLYSQVFKRFIFKDDTSGGDSGDDIQTDVTEPTLITGGGSTSGGGGSTSGGGKSSAPKVDIDKKLTKGSKGDLVFKIQIAANKIAAARGKTSYFDKDKNKTIKFPIAQDKDFGTTTDSAAKFAFPSYRNSGYITVRKAREQWVRSFGHFKRPFPSELVNVSNYADLKKIYDINRAKKEANDEVNWGAALGYTVGGVLNPGAALGYTVGSILNP